MGIYYDDLSMYDLEEELEGGVVGAFLKKDDSEKFKKYLEDNKEKFNKDDSESCCAILDLCFTKNAKKCSVVMLNRSFTSKYKFLHAFHPGTLVNITLDWQDPDILQFMFRHCYADHLSNQTYGDTLAIHEILFEIMNDDPFTQWGKGDSLIKFVILLISAHKARSRLECARLVVENTSSINEVAMGLFHAGDVKELAALLLLAYDDVFPSLKSGLRKVVSKDGLPTISSAHMVSRAIHGDVADVYALVYLFHKAGRDLSNLYTSMTGDEKPEDVIIKVALLIKNAGFPITYTDVDLSLVYSFRHDVTKSICKAVGVKKNNGIKLGYKKPRFASVYYDDPYPYNHGVWVDRKYISHRGPAHIPLQPIRKYCSAPQNHTISASKLAHSSPSLRSVAFLAMRLTRGIRML